MSTTLNLIEAATAFVVSLEQPIVTDYQIGLFIFQSYQYKEYADQPLRLKKQNPEFKDYKRVIQTLIDKKIIFPSKVFPDLVFNIQNKPPALTEEILCIINPFVYLSHLSAMSYYDFSEFEIGNIYLSSLPLNLLREKVYNRMKMDCGGSENLNNYYSNLPPLKAIEIDRMDDISINVYHSKHIGSFKEKGNKRIATIERTFLDMLRKPDFCGGMKHVVQVYKKHILHYLESVLKEIDTHGNQIEKVRAGYILEECCGIKDDIIESWLHFAQRGGSRKLDPFKEYSHRYSERWCISLNI